MGLAGYPMPVSSFKRLWPSLRCAMGAGVGRRASHRRDGGAGRHRGRCAAGFVARGRPVDPRGWSFRRYRDEQHHASSGRGAADDPQRRPHRTTLPAARRGSGWARERSRLPPAARLDLSAGLFDVPNSPAGRSAGQGDASSVAAKRAGRGRISCAGAASRLRQPSVRCGRHRGRVAAKVALELPLAGRFAARLDALRSRRGTVELCRRRNPRGTQGRSQNAADRLPTTTAITSAATCASTAQRHSSTIARRAGEPDAEVAALRLARCRRTAGLGFDLGGAMQRHPSGQGCRPASATRRQSASMSRRT